jgi:alanine-synthesizing transaminase
VGRADGAWRLPERARAGAAGRAAVRIAPCDRRGRDAFVGVDTRRLPGFDDRRFALDLLEHKHVLVAPGTSFNVPYNTHFRVTNLPEPEILADVFQRMEELLDNYAAGDEPVSRPSPLRAVEA